MTLALLQKDYIFFTKKYAQTKNIKKKIIIGEEDGDGGQGGQKEEEDSRQKSSEKLRSLLLGIMNK
jgi:hypothetical protein